MMNEKMNIDQELLLRYLDGELDSVERRALDERLASDPALATSLARLRASRDAMRGARAESFALGFAERVAARVKGAGGDEEAFYGALAWLFRRAAIAGLAAAALFGALNLADYQDYGVSTTVIESIFGLPSVSLDEALAIEPV